MNVEQEIWDDFKTLSNSSLMDRLSYSTANAHFEVSYEDKNNLVHNGLNKRLENDEDYKLNQFLLKSNYKDVNWNELGKLYPNWQPIELPKISNIKYPVPKFRTIQERSDINTHLFNNWEQKRDKLYLKIPNETAAKDYLINIRWGSSPICPRCENKKIYLLDSGTVNFKCAKCKLHFSERVGTIFQNSKLTLIKWYEAMYLITGIKTQKISTHQLAKAISVTQKTSWGMATKIQSKIKDDFIDKIRKELFK